MIRKKISEFLQWVDERNLEKAIEELDKEKGNRIRAKGLPDLVHIRIMQDSYDYSESKNNRDLFLWNMWTYYWKEIIKAKIKLYYLCLRRR